MKKVVLKFFMPRALDAEMDGRTQTKKIRRLFFLGILMMGALLIIKPIFAQQPGPVCIEYEFFPDTGHNVCDRFLDFFHSRGGLEIFGYPITEQFVENGRLVQYFQRARMEYHPENPPAYHVQLGLLGDFLAPADRKARIPESERPRSNDRNRIYAPETGHTIGFSFLEFYNENGGLDIFGYPVTEFILENGRYVQYFQRALMEWDPNPKRIKLHDLGTVWVEQHDHLRPLRTAVPSLALDRNGEASAPAVTSLHATALVQDAITGRQGSQTVWVYVYAQNGEPVIGATISLIIHYPSGDRDMVMNPTDQQGHSQVTFRLENPPRGQLVIIDAIVEYGGLSAQAHTSFFPWW
jgi:hypothetical protein